MVARVDSTRAEPEDLEELKLDRLRDLDLAEPPVPEMPKHLASASGVARRGRYVYAIGDESNHLAQFDLPSGEPGTLHRALSGEMPADAGERKKQKSDLESLTVLPPGDGSSHGVLLGIGSGSGPGRDRGFAWDLEANGGLRGDPREIDLAPIYELLGGEIDGLNVEGAAVLGSELLLFHRGNEDRDGNAIARIPLQDALDSVLGDLRFDASELASLRRYELGELNGVELCFSDANPLGDDAVVFTASAEDADGAIHGSVLGVLDTDGSVRRLRQIDRRWKVEGVHATTDAGVLDLLFVCDQDDPEEPSPLLGASMPMRTGLE